MNKRLVTGEKRETTNWIIASVNWTIPGQKDLLTLKKTLNSTQRCSQVLSYPSLSPLLKDGYRGEPWDQGWIPLSKWRSVIAQDISFPVRRLNGLNCVPMKEIADAKEKADELARRAKRTCRRQKRLLVRRDVAGIKSRMQRACIWSNQYQAWDAVFHHQMKHWEKSDKNAENTTRSGVLLTNFEVLHLVMKHCVKCLILLHKQNEFRRRN